MFKTLVATAAVALFASGAHAGLAGNSINVSYIFPDANTVYADNGTSVISATGATSFNLGGYTGNVLISDNLITVNFGGSSTWSDTPFNGIRVTNLSGGMPGLFTVDPNSLMAGLTNANISYTSNSFSVNWAGMPFSSTAPAVFSVASVAAVPEPETYAMLLAGLGMVGAIARRKSKSGSSSLAA